MEIFDEIFRPPMDYTPPRNADEALRVIAAERPVRVLDLGANIGLFGVATLGRYPGAEVASYEPEPANFEVLRRCVAENSDARWTIMQACAMTASGQVHVTPNGFADSYVASTGVAVPGVDVLPELCRYDFVKMDIEGSEWPILLDDRWPQAMRNVTAFALEWHERHCPMADPAAVARTAVEAAGFTARSGPAGRPYGFIWGWAPGRGLP
jgi:FkbM family methyltransferase